MYFLASSKLKVVTRNTDRLIAGAYQKHLDTTLSRIVCSFVSELAEVKICAIFPIEVFENQVPMLVTEKALVPDTGGAGKFRGGSAQRIGFRSLADSAISMAIKHERIRFPPRGLLGGMAGSPGRDLVNGEQIQPKSRTMLAPGDEIVFQTPGGGGLHPPGERSQDMIQADLESGLVTREKAIEAYGDVD